MLVVAWDTLVAPGRVHLCNACPRPMRRSCPEPDFRHPNHPVLGAPAGGTRLPVAREADTAPRAAAVKAARRAPAKRVGAKRRALMAASTVRTLT